MKPTLPIACLMSAFALALSGPLLANNEARAAEQRHEDHKTRAEAEERGRGDPARGTPSREAPEPQE